MRNRLARLLAFTGAVLISQGALRAATVVYTLPVGVMKITGSANSGGAAAKLSFDALSLTQPVEYQGSATASGTNTVTDSGATWVDNQFNGTNGPYYLEVISVSGSTAATGVGSTYSIAATSGTTKTVTLASNLLSGVTPPFGYRIRKHWTIGSVFGTTDSAGLQGGSAVSADQVLLWNGVGYDTYYYQTSGIGGTGWRKSTSRTADASSDIIYLDDCVIIKRGQSAAVSFYRAGALKTGQTIFTVVTGFNYFSNPYGAAMTLATSGLYTGNATTGVAASTSADAADQVFIWNGTSYDIYYYNSAAGGWRKSTDAATSANATPLPLGAGFIVRRLSSVGFNWTLPQSPTSL